MNNYTQQLHDEHYALSIKIQEINSYIHGNEKFKTLSGLEQVKMIKQAGFMEAYADILMARIWTNK